MTGRALVFGTMIIAAAHDALGQQVQQQARASRAGRRVVLPIAEEIQLARSAAPAAISANARVLIMTDTGYAIADSGTTAVTCVVNRSWDKSVEPHCYGPEGAATVMPIELRRNYLRHVGKSEDEIDADLARGLMAGRFRLPTSPALTYMMSGAQVLYDDNGTHVGKWRPHLMIYYPNLTTKGLGLPGRPEMRIGMVSGDGTAESSLVIVMPAFVELMPPKGP